MRRMWLATVAAAGVVAAEPTRAELTASECEALILGAKLGQIEARRLILAQARAFVDAVADQDGSDDARRSDPAFQALDRDGTLAWDAYVAALEADCEAITP